ncbi:putative response regulator receiver protein [Selenomonas ruminantium subsp. lactilytica TAM6421]|uniref:Putative response regulator receiver protein n=1 Tax=Selenomonas ruminantium subsp. lactilytica (strain NBRC 103574 / TAM6421) TaxID=927704 RepID=I0GQZ1_SELRL|nr:HD domain-containing phosphohydrolase [Selenomonas ruminantium]BAL83178.1 putative response regulator receiver protein [Selenomonas ruminantium subsp. lactilytica TAM6421]
MNTPSFIKRRIMAVDDDDINRMTLEAILSVDYDFTAVSSGPEALDLLAGQPVDLILLDINMPEMNGFEVLAALQQGEKTCSIPVIMLTGDLDQETEVQGIQAGAFDFVHKPFIPTLILRRIERTLELKALQHHMQQEIDRQTAIAKEQLASTQRLFHEMVETLADTIDAKDKYTHGHSRRVADYAREIARRAGKSEEYQRAVYYMAQLHDIGKIGIPSSLINKSTKLTDEEYAAVQQHTLIGSDILAHVKEMPELLTAARSHHERYDGTGYPEGLIGTAIPEKVRIIAVADVYDAMTSKRSYRDVLSQAVVRQEMLNARGKQLDPVFTDIMLQMIDEDIHYQLREK